MRAGGLGIRGAPPAAWRGVQYAECRAPGRGRYCGITGGGVDVGERCVKNGHRCFLGVRAPRRYAARGHSLPSTRRRGEAFSNPQLKPTAWPRSVQDRCRRPFSPACISREIGGDPSMPGPLRHASVPTHSERLRATAGAASMARLVARTVCDRPERPTGPMRGGVPRCSWRPGTSSAFHPGGGSPLPRRRVVGIGGGASPLRSRAAFVRCEPESPPSS